MENAVLNKENLIESEFCNNKKITTDTLEMKFEFNMVELLGSQLYTTLPAIISEFVSNSYDADATKVEVIIEENDNTPNSRFINITIKDNGSGISPSGENNIFEINNRFLRIGRKRRQDEKNSCSPKLKRKLQGKKGIGKLAGFGITDKIEVSTTTSGITNAFILDINQMKLSKSDTYYPEILINNINIGERDGTVIKLIDIKKKKSIDMKDLSESIAKRLQIFDVNFSLDLYYVLNGLSFDPVPLTNDNYFKYIKDDKKEQFSWKIPECLEELELESDIIDYFGNYNINGEIFTTDTPLKKQDQGLILYANGKLCQDSYSFSERANDNFYSYLIGCLNIDYIDQDINTDNISTSRDSLVWENEISQTLKEKIDVVIKKIQIKWREKRKETKEETVNKKLKTDVNSWINDLNDYERKSARKLIDIVLNDENMDDAKTLEYVGYIQDMYSFTSFKDFAENLCNEPVSNIEDVLEFIKKWDFIETKEMAKISNGRIETINNFEKMIHDDKSETKFIQPFIEKFPWILDPRIMSFEREVTYRAYLKEHFNDNKLDEPDRRIDFLTYMSNGELYIMELKRPNLKIKKDYIFQVHDYKTFIQGKNPNIKVKTYLITNNCNYDRTVQSLIDAAKKDNVFEIKTYTEMISEARQYHRDIIEKYEELYNKKEESN